MIEPIHAGLEVGTIILIASVAMSAASILMATKVAKPDAPLRDRSKPTTLADRGSYIQYLIGRRRVGPVFAWAGLRRIESRARPSGASGGKGGGGESSSYVDLYFESGVHWLCVGPAYKLSKIWRNGKSILTRPITRDSHPSGTIITVGGGTFEIYWGEENQPVNSRLGQNQASSGKPRMGISSRWPGVCYIYWRDLRLGQQAVWPQLEYDIEVVPEDADMSNVTSGFMEGSLGTPTGSAYSIVGCGTGSNGTAFFSVNDPGGKSLRKRFHPGRYAVVSGNTYGGGSPITVRVFRSTYNSATGVTRVYVYNNVGACNAAGTLQSYAAELHDDGMNPAAMIDRMLTAEWPKGLGFDPDAIDVSLDATKLTNLSTLFDTEGMASSLLIKDGEEADAALGRVMQDMGLMLSWNSDTGKWWPYPVRDESSPPTIPSTAVLKLPRPQVIHGGVNRSEQLVYTFTDRQRKWKDTTITISDDGGFETRGHAKERSIDLALAIGYSVADKVAERRSLEDLNDGGVFTIETNRETRLMVPGMAFKVSGVVPTLRLTSKTITTNGNKVTLKAIPDFYGLALSTHASEQGGGVEDDSDIDVEPDEEVFASPTSGGGGSSGGGGAGGEGASGPGGTAGFSGPDGPGTEGVAGGWGSGVIINRIRANEQSGAADIYISQDDASYELVGSTSNFQAGGRLRADLPASEPVPDGWEFDILGPDISQVLDLGGNDPAYNSGRQLMMINDEIFFLRSISIDGSGTFATITQGIRGRHNTAFGDHVAGDAVFIMPFDRMTVVSHPYLQQAGFVYIKVVPRGTSDIEPGEGEILLDEIPPVVVSVPGGGLYFFRDSAGRVYSSGDAVNWDRIPSQAAWIDTATGTLPEVIDRLKNSGAISDTP